MKVQAAREEEKENAKIDADIKAEVERGKREELVTEELQTVKEQILKEISNLKESVSIEKQTIENIAKEKDRLQDLIVASLEVMDDFFKVDDSHSLQQLKSRAEELLQFQILKLLPYVMHYDIKRANFITDDENARYGRG